MEDKLFIDKNDIFNNEKIQKLVLQIKSGTVKIEELTELQKKIVGIYLEIEVSEKKQELKNKKNVILYKKMKNEKNRRELLNKLSYEDKISFYNFLNEVNSLDML